MNQAQESIPPDDLTGRVAAAFRKTEAELDTHNQRISALVDRVAILEAGPPSAGEGTESSPSEHWWVKVRLEELEARFNRLQFQTEGRFQRLETRVAEMQEMILGVEQRLGDLEPGPPSPELTSLHGRCPTCGRLRDARADTVTTLGPTMYQPVTEDGSS